MHTETGLQTCFEEGNVDAEETC